MLGVLIHIDSREVHLIQRYHPRLINELVAEQKQEEERLCASLDREYSDWSRAYDRHVGRQKIRDRVRGTLLGGILLGLLIEDIGCDRGSDMGTARWK